MNTNRLQTNRFSAMLQRLHIHRGLFFGIILVGALLAFEVFNFSTTEFALHDLLGEFCVPGNCLGDDPGFSFLRDRFCRNSQAFYTRRRIDRARRSVVPVRSLAACGFNERDSHLVGRINCHPQPPISRQCSGSTGNIAAGCSSLRGDHGLADPGADYWYFLCSRSTPLHPERCTSSIFRASNNAQFSGPPSGTLCWNQPAPCYPGIQQ